MPITGPTAFVRGIRAICLTLLLAVHAMVSHAGTNDILNVTGTWRAVDSDDDESVLNLLQKGDQVQGTLTQYGIPSTILDGRIRGSSIGMTFTYGSSTGKLTATVSGDRMTDGICDSSTGPRLTWTAHRQTGVEPEISGFGVIVRDFTANRRKLVADLSKRLNLPLPAEVDAFFGASEAGNWIAITNRFNAFFPTGERRDGVMPALLNELWSPILETLGIHEVWVAWRNKTHLLEAFYEPVLSSMPKGCIYFGGTDYGRFVITAVNAMATPPAVYCITQNALADYTYPAHLKAVYGNDIWIPGNADLAFAFQQYVQDVQAGRTKSNAELKIENGRVQVSGVTGVMLINAIICEMIFINNKDKHDFFVEESYAMEWMYPYLEPHGLIMKLNKQPLGNLTKATVKRDTDFWRNTVTSLRKERGFDKNPEARKAFSKLRCAIAGVYVYRKQYDAARAAFLQAMDLCPASPEVNVRLAMMYEELGNVGEALKVMEKYVALDTHTIQQYAETYGPYSPDKAKTYLDGLRAKRALTPDEQKELAGLILLLGASNAVSRTEARRRIEVFGAVALPFLQEYEDADDPEIRMEIRDIIVRMKSRSGSAKEE